MAGRTLAFYWLVNRDCVGWRVWLSSRMLHEGETVGVQPFTVPSLTFSLNICNTLFRETIHFMRATNCVSKVMIQYYTMYYENNKCNTSWLLCALHCLVTNEYFAASTLMKVEREGRLIPDTESLLSGIFLRTTKYCSHSSHFWVSGRLCFVYVGVWKVVFCCVSVIVFKLVCIAVGLLCVCGCLEGCMSGGFWKVVCLWVPERLCVCASLKCSVSRCCKLVCQGVVSLCV